MSRRRACLVQRSRPQLYGTQFINDETGVLRPEPIQDLDVLDERRAAIGLEAFAEYEATMHAIWTDQSAT